MQGTPTGLPHFSRYRAHHIQGCRWFAEPVGQKKNMLIPVFEKQGDVAPKMHIYKYLNVLTSTNL